MNPELRTLIIIGLVLLLAIFINTALTASSIHIFATAQKIQLPESKQTSITPDLNLYEHCSVRAQPDTDADRESESLRRCWVHDYTGYVTSVLGAERGTKNAD